MDLKIVSVVIDTRKIKKVASPLIGKVVCVCGIYTTYLMPNGTMEIKSCLNT
jgi:hypothetical protein